MTLSRHIRTNLSDALLGPTHVQAGIIALNDYLKRCITEAETQGKVPQLREAADALAQKVYQIQQRHEKRTEKPYKLTLGGLEAELFRTNMLAAPHDEGGLRPEPSQQQYDNSRLFAVFCLGVEQALRQPFQDDLRAR